MTSDKNCPDCERSFGFFRWRWKCDICSIVRCNNCMEKIPDFKWYLEAPFPKGKMCKKCRQEKVKPALASYSKILEKAENLPTWPVTYKGKISYDRNLELQNIESNWHKNRDHALQQLKVTAALNGFDLVIEVQFIKDTDSTSSNNGKGTYYYSVWKAIGKAALSPPKEVNP